MILKGAVPKQGHSWDATLPVIGLLARRWIYY